MTLRTTIVLLVVLLVGASVALAGGYVFTVNGALKAGNTEVTPGEYRVSVQGSLAIVTNTLTAKSFTLIVKTETGDAKFNETLLETEKKDGQTTVLAIDLGGSNTRLVVD